MKGSCGIKKLYRGAGRGYGGAGRICRLRVMAGWYFFNCRKCFFVRFLENVFL